MTTTKDRPGGSRRSLGRARELAPGLGVIAAGVGVSLLANRILPAVSALTVAVLLGVLAAPLVPGRAREGLSWATRKFLRVGVVLLGLQLGLDQVTDLGAATVVAVVAVVLLAFVGTVALGRLLGVSRGMGLLVATGFSICGASAIAAMDSVTRNEKEDVATAVALVTLYGSAAILLVPLIGEAAGMPPELLGAWAGLAVHEVAQVVAAASPAGAAAVGVAVVVKLTRVILLAPMVAGVSLVERRRRDTSGSARPPLVPLFVVGFLATMVLRSSGVVPEAVLSVAATTTTVLFTAALFGLGTGVRLGALIRTGHRALALGALSTLLVGGAAVGALALGGGFGS